ncbi:hypothetical protein GALL_461090 [mine drainage metagenome]|uniref:Uncharacterized protein n=1 Tax=mine drainage metagenome TaxID=410659 RepID=A0A1J5Q472_9ZZZZ
MLTGIGCGHHVALLGLGQFGDCVHGGNFHFGSDGRRAAVERAAEDVRKAQHVVDLIGIVRTAGGDDGVGSHRAGFFRHDLRGGIGQRQDDGLGRHALRIRGLEHTARRQSEEHVGIADDVGQGARGRVLREVALVLVHQFGPSCIHDAGQVADPDVVPRHPQVFEQTQAGQRRRSRPRTHQLDLGDVLADDLQAVEDGRADNDGRAMLVVVEYRNLHAGAQLALDLEALRRLDVFQVDSAECRFERGDDVHQLVGVGFVHLDVEHVDPGKLLEQHGFALHHRLGRQRADIAQPQHRSAVGNDRDQIAPRGVAEHIIWMSLDFLAGRGHSG